MEKFSQPADENEHILLPGQSAVKLANHNARYNCIVISFFQLVLILTVAILYIAIIYIRGVSDVGFSIFADTDANYAF